MCDGFTLEDRVRPSANDELKAEWEANSRITIRDLAGELDISNWTVSERLYQIKSKKLENK